MTINHMLRCVFDMSGGGVQYSIVVLTCEAEVFNILLLC